MDLFSSRLRTALTTGAALVLLAPAAMAAGMQLSSVDAPAEVPSAPVDLASSNGDEVGAVQTALGKDLRHVVYAAVAAEGGVPLGRGGSCPTDRLRVSWTAPGAGYRTGAFISPVGPKPTATTQKVNGVVLCSGSHQAFLGFDAVRTGSGWDVQITPDPAGGVDDEEKPGSNRPDTTPVPKPLKKATGLAGAATGAAIEGYARYEGQSTCSPGAKPGTLALRNLLLARYPSTTSLGISRGCGVGGRSEHKEGRAFDWGASVSSPADVAAVQDFLSSVFATDSHGNANALVRRMGIMYVIWDHRIWSAYRAGEGWRPYTGSSPHTDHTHISLSWAGALGQTSFWSGKVVEGLSSIPSGGGSGTRSAVHHRTATHRTGTPSTTHHRRHHPVQPPTTGWVPRPTRTAPTEPRPERPRPTRTHPTAWPTGQPTWSWPTDGQARDRSGWSGTTQGTGDRPHHHRGRG